MTGYVRTCDGRRLTLPALLQWSVRLTDGDPCDSFSVRFLYEAELSEALRKAVLFEAGAGQDGLYRRCGRLRDPDG